MKANEAIQWFDKHLLLTSSKEKHEAYTLAKEALERVIEHRLRMYMQLTYLPSETRNNVNGIMHRINCLPSPTLTEYNPENHDLMHLGELED